MFSITVLPLLEKEGRASESSSLFFCGFFFRPFFADNSFHSSLIVIRRLLPCRFASPSHEIVFALMSHSHSMTSSALLIRFAIFRALDIYSTNSVNTVFLAGSQVSCDQSPS